MLSEEGSSVSFLFNGVVENEICGFVDLIQFRLDRQKRYTSIFIIRIDISDPENSILRNFRNLFMFPRNFGWLIR